MRANRATNTKQRRRCCASPTKCYQVQYSVTLLGSRPSSLKRELEQELLQFVDVACRLGTDCGHVFTPSGTLTRSAFFGERTMWCVACRLPFYYYGPQMTRLPPSSNSAARSAAPAGSVSGVERAAVDAPPAASMVPIAKVNQVRAPFLFSRSI